MLHITQILWQVTIHLWLYWLTVHSQHWPKTLYNFKYIFSKFNETHFNSMYLSFLLSISVTYSPSYSASIPRNAVSNWIDPIRVQMASFHILPNTAHCFSVLMLESGKTSGNRDNLLNIQKKHSAGSVHGVYRCYQRRKLSTKKTRILPLSVVICKILTMNTKQFLQ